MITSGNRIAALDRKDFGWSECYDKCILQSNRLL